MWSTGGPDFRESIERTLGKYKSFTDLWEWMKEHGWEDYKLTGQFMAYYDPNAHFDESDEYEDEEKKEEA